jgi:prepilin-type N-terminal cleavage/methylation domain-containing protein
MKARAGFTLTETLVVVLVGALVMGSIYQMVIMQDRTTREQYARVETAQNARTSLAVMVNDLKEISAADGDIIAADSSDITFRALRKAALSCSKGTNSSLDVWVLGAPFEAGDSVLVFAEGNVNSTADDQWVRGQLQAVLPGALCGGYDPYGVTIAKMKTLVFTGAPLANVNNRTFVRSFITTRYRTQNNGEWGQLMRTDTAAEQPIIDRLATETDGGLRLRYFNAAGTQIANNNLSTNLNNIMRIQVKVRGKAAATVSRTGENRFQDSLVTSVYLRGNYRTQ